MSGSPDEGVSSFGQAPDIWKSQMENTAHAEMNSPKTLEFNMSWMHRTHCTMLSGICMLICV